MNDLVQPKHDAPHLPPTYPGTVPVPVRWDLSNYTAGDYDRGRSLVSAGLWWIISLFVFESGWVPLYAVKRGLLRIFGARVGSGVVIKPRVRIKYPWRLRLGDHVWIGEDVWLDNLDLVDIGDHACLSQGVYVCTGSHDFRSVQFNLKTAPVRVSEVCWVGARATLLPGVNLPPQTLVPAGTVVRRLKSDR